MNIVYFIDHLRPDGSQRVLRQLVEGLSARGHTQVVVSLNNSADPLLMRFLHDSGVATRIIGKRNLLTGRGLFNTWRWLCREQFDVAVTMLFAADVIGRLLAWAAGTRYIVSSLRARNTHYAFWQRWLVRQTMPWADAVILNSAATQDFAVEQEGVQPERIVVIPNGVATDVYRNPISGEALRKELGLPHDHCLVGSVGRLTHQKGFDLLVEAFASMSRSDVDLLLIGQGEEESRLRSQATALGLEERVHFMGYRRDVPRLLGALDLYVHPARFEGMPNALLEAMAAGCPIVASGVDGNRELIEDGVHGWLVTPENVEALAGAVCAALADPAERRHRASNAMHRASTRYSVEAMITSWERVLCAKQR